jgi:hypothetical protein
MLHLLATAFGESYYADPDQPLSMVHTFSKPLGDVTEVGPAIPNITGVNRNAAWNGTWRRASSGVRVIDPVRNLRDHPTEVGSV